jgi:hypothetical protein
MLTPDYRHNSAGIRVMHYFAYLLKCLGHTVDTNCTVFNKAYGDYMSSKDYNGKYDFIVAPEGSYIPPDINKPIFRWVLFNTDLKYNVNDIVFHWCKDYEQSAREASFNGESGIFRLGDIDRNEYKNNKEKTKVCYWVHKGLSKWGECPKPENEAIQITHQYPSDRQGLLNLLKECKVFYTYDSHSAINEEAYLCGAKVLMYCGKQGAGQADVWKEYIPEIKEEYYKDEKADIKRVKEVLKEFWVRYGRI